MTYVYECLTKKCHDCPAAALLGRARCTPCAQTHRERNRARYVKRPPRQPAKSRRPYMLARYQDKRNRGECVRNGCKVAAVTGKTLCERHGEWSRHYARRAA